MNDRKLPHYDQRPVAKVKHKMTGGDEKTVTRAMHLRGDEEVMIIARAYVNGTNHQFTEDGLVRTDALKVTRLVVIPVDLADDFHDLAQKMDSWDDYVASEVYGLTGFGFGSDDAEDAADHGDYIETLAIEQ